MSITLPEPVVAFFAAANRDDADALSLCFVDGAVVRDEGRRIKGIAAIKRWHSEAKKKYHHTLEPVDSVERDGKIVVIGKVSGSFPNSPVNLEHIFGLRGGRIASLEIR